jgi:hypothetical protein
MVRAGASVNRQRLHGAGKTFISNLLRITNAAGEAATAAEAGRQQAALEKAAAGCRHSKDALYT